ncbi:RluA family pseudouridine synthase [Lacibacterium aquatile]|uniref:Pseudouridine synthase n=1 Tax=Lacibacterium aquatile TaxID=1168082 RepID=A0ABW5DRD9_9PROT
MTAPLHLTLPDELSGERLDRALAVQLPDLSRSRLKTLIEEGRVSLVGGATVTDPSVRVKGGQSFAILPPDPEPAEPVPQDIALAVVYEDDALIVIDKPAGMVVHPAPGNPDGTLVNALIFHCGDSLKGIGGELRPGIVHRIDKETSGLLVAAKTEVALNGLAAQFAAHDVERCYRAFVWGAPVPGSGEIEGPIGRHPIDRKKMAVVSKGGKPALTRYKTVARFGGGIASEVECRLATGRTHQIRVHMTKIGHPLLGDPVYGNPKVKGTSAPLAKFLKDWQRQALHAATLGFRHPVTGEALRFESALPHDLTILEAYLKQLHIP